MFRAVLDEITLLDDAALIAEFDAIESEVRRLCARRAAVVSAIERRSIPAATGNGSTAGWVRARLNSSPREATAIVRAARLVHDHPVVGEALHAGRVGAEHAARLGAAHRNPRCGDLLGNVVDLLVEHAATLRFEDFKLCVDRWVLLADPDGAQQRDDARHEQRTATVASDADGGLFVHAAGACAAGVELTEIFDRFVEAEFQVDWERCRAVHGDAAARALMDRTDPQRRFDAFVAIFRAAASAPADHVNVAPVVNIVIDEATFNAHLALAITGQRVDRDPIEVLRSGRCETIDGKPVLPADAVAAAMIGHVRRVVYNAASVPIDLGRRQRLYIGAARDAAQLLGRRCFHPGCHVPVQRCQIDHMEPWPLGGSTSPLNARVACSKHNRWLNHAHRVTRDRFGTWHTHEPEHTPLSLVGLYG